MEVCALNLLGEWLPRWLGTEQLQWDREGLLEFEWLAEVARPAFPEGAVEVLLEAADDVGMGDLVRQSYVRRVSESHWRLAVRSAEPAVTSAASEWVSVVPTASGDVVTFPQDSSPLPRMSLFVRVNGSVRRVSAELHPDLGVLTAVSLSAGRHCGFPDQLQCEPGSCGTCQLTLREIKPRGWICACPHNA
jgi:hypothetical protein